MRAEFAVQKTTICHYRQPPSHFIYSFIRIVDIKVLIRADLAMNQVISLIKEQSSFCKTIFLYNHLKHKHDIFSYLYCV